eukprot:8919910-Karenia_brevis.AAC.1
MQQLEPFACTISVNAVISACEIDGEWQRLAPLFHETQQLEPSPRCGQLQLSHLSLKEGRTVTARAPLFYEMRQLEPLP